MASINDLATAATIAPSDEDRQPAATPLTQLPGVAQTWPPQPRTPLPQRHPQAPSSFSSSSVLVAPQLPPHHPAQVHMAAPPPPPTVPAPAPAPASASASRTVAAATQRSPAVAGDVPVNGPAATATGPAWTGPARGAFIVLEGMDRAGKTTQARLLQQRCIEEGRQARFMTFPDRTTPIGHMIDAYLHGQTVMEDHAVHLLFSANRWEAVATIKQTLAAGASVICDRYYHSGVVYSAAKQNPSLPLSWTRAPEVGLPRPDLVLFLDLEEDVARERGGWGQEVYERGEMQRRVRDLFWRLSMGDLGKTDMSDAGVEDGAASVGVPGGEWVVFRQEEEDLQIVDASVGVEELAEKVWDMVRPRLEAVERAEVGRTVRLVA